MPFINIFLLILGVSTFLTVIYFFIAYKKRNWPFQKLPPKNAENEISLKTKTPLIQVLIVTTISIIVFSLIIASIYTTILRYDKIKEAIKNGNFNLSTLTEIPETGLSNILQGI